MAWVGSTGLHLAAAVRSYLEPSKLRRGVELLIQEIAIECPYVQIEGSISRPSPASWGLCPPS